MLSLFLNEVDPYCCGWLRNLYPGAHVEEKDVKGVVRTDLVGVDRVHLFAGIGGWEEALRLAGWPDGSPVWTGSCPCQPWSKAGRGKKERDSRDLWPEMFRLVRECRPVTVFGEQVANAIKWGWLDRVFSELEGEGYACGAAVLGAHSVGAPHLRQRVFWVAHAGGQRIPLPGRRPDDGPTAGVAEEGDQRQRVRADSRPVGIVGDAGGTGREGLLRGQRTRSPDRWGLGAGPAGGPAAAPGSLGFWDQWEPVHFRDGSWRRIEPGLEPLAHGVFKRASQLRAYGNAIVPQLGAVFIRAFMEAVGWVTTR